MATPNVGILTNAGKNLIDQVNAGQTKITFSKIVFSSMDNNQLTDDQIKALTTVAPQEIVVNNPEVTLDNDTGETRIRATGNNEALTDGVYVKTYAVYAKDDSGNEILYGTTVSPNPNYLPEYDGVTPQAVTYSYKVNISNTSNITFTNSNDVYVSDTDLAEAIQPYAKTVDVNQQLDKKVIDNKNGTEQLNGVQVQPFNKLSDTIGGRNLLINTQNPSATNPVKFVGVTVPSTSATVTFSDGFTKLTSTVSSTEGETYYRFAAPVSTLMPLPAGTYTLVVDLTSSDNVYVMPRGQYSTDGTAWNDMALLFWTLSSTEKQFSYTFTIPSNATGWYISLEMYADTNATPDNTGKSFQFRNASIQKGDIATDSSPAPEDKVNVSDMRKPASDVAGIEEVNAKQDKIGYTPADDSTVAHLSGANNFDAVPTVNNNPLLLASSLPSDLARTGSDQEFTGKNTFDTAPIDKTTGNPYITKDGVPAVPSTLADTTKDANFTGKLQKYGVDVATVDDVSAKQDKLNYTPANDDNVIHRDPNTGAVTESGNFPELQVKGVSVATSDDLKSVKESAWYMIPENNSNMIRDIGWMKRDSVNNYLYILYNFATVPWVPTVSDMLVDLSSYVDTLDDSRGYIMLSSNNWLNINGKWTLPHSYRAMSTVFASGSTLIVGSGFNYDNPNDNDGGNYLNLTTFDDSVDDNAWTNKCIRVHYNKWIGS